MVAGLIDISVLKLDAYQFSTPYYFTHNVFARQPLAQVSVVDAFLNIFKCFSLTTWGVIGLEMINAILLFFAIEVTPNPTGCRPHRAHPACR